MHLVDYYNVRAFRELGWTVVMGPADDKPCISFFHQGAGRMGKPSLHYSCTSSISTVARNLVPVEKTHDVVFCLNTLMVNNFGKQGITSRIWPHGLDTADCARFDKEEKYGNFTIVNVAQGSFGPEASIKGISWLVDALLKIPEVSFVQIGANWGPETLIPISSGKVKVKDLPPRFTFRGIVSHQEALKAMAKSHLMVSTSVGEGLPLPAMEALGLGLPHLTTDLPYTRDWPVSTVVRRMPSRPFFNPAYLHDQPFSPRSLEAYDVPPHLFMPTDIHGCIMKVMEGFDSWAKECVDYRFYAREHATWKSMAARFAVPVLKELGVG